MKKNLIKIACFGIVFIVLFFIIQNILQYRWRGNEDLYTKYIYYSEESEDTIDMLYFGTSELFAGVVPIVTYHESGITGYNFCVSYRSAVTAYYQLLYTLQCQTAPKMVACDFSCLYTDMLPSDIEMLYRKIVDTMPDKTIKKDLIRDICSLDKNQSCLDWYFPLLHYHNMWNELTTKNFESIYQVNEKYPSYQKGSLLNNSEFSGEMYEITPELWNADEHREEFSEVSIKYYDMFIEECQNRNIQVIALIPPKISQAKYITSRWEQMKEYFDTRGVSYLNYNTYEEVKRMGLDFETDYYNVSHLNTLGSIKFSKILATDLKNKYSFIDHRNDVKCANQWDADWRAFEEDTLDRQSSLYRYIITLSEFENDFVIKAKGEDIWKEGQVLSLLRDQGIDINEISEDGNLIIQSKDHVMKILKEKPDLQQCWEW